MTEKPNRTSKTVRDVMAHWKLFTHKGSEWNHIDVFTIWQVEKVCNQVRQKTLEEVLAKLRKLHPYEVVLEAVVEVEDLEEKSKLFELRES